MKIPKRFKLLGRTIEVKEDPELLHERNWTGSANYTKGLINLQPINATYPATPEKRGQIFCHEFVHHIAYHAGAAINHELSKQLHDNEEFVDLFGSLLHQALTTMEYEADGRL